MKYEPIKITAHMAGSICGDPPMLDALLEFVMAFHAPSIAKARGRNITIHPRGQPVTEIGTLPIGVARATVDGLPVPCCSSPIFSEPLWEGTAHVHKRWGDDRDALDPSRRGVISTTSGALKGYRLPFRLRFFEKIVWFAVGNAAYIRRRLKKVVYLGKKTAYGHGRVLGWVVEPHSCDLSWFAESEGKRVLMRPLPFSDLLRVGNLAGFRQDYGSPCPPYWQRSLYRDIVVPC